MARRKSTSVVVGDKVFYLWKREWLPAIIVGFDENERAILNIFTVNGVVVVHRVVQGNGDQQFSLTPGNPAPVVPDSEE